MTCQTFCSRGVCPLLPAFIWKWLERVVLKNEVCCGGAKDFKHAGGCSNDHFTSQPSIAAIAEPPGCLGGLWPQWGQLHLCGSLKAAVAIWSNRSTVICRSLRSNLPISFDKTKEICERSCLFAVFCHHIQTLAKGLGGSRRSGSSCVTRQGTRMDKCCTVVLLFWSHSAHLPLLG